jgi:serine/threonine protein kinase
MEAFFENEDEEFVEQFLLEYKPIKIIGQGAFSIVFKATDLYYSREVAIKVLCYTV